MSKAFLCPCEDVSEKDVRAALDKGFCDIESIKRYTGFGTGICQGKSCLSAVARMLSRREGEGGKALRPFTPRPPLFPLELEALASADEQTLGRHAEALPAQLDSERVQGPGPRSAQRAEPLPQRASVVIIGGGIMGLALAHSLAGLGQRDIVVLEKGYLCAGASGRNGGGVRMQWGTPTNIQLAKRSIELMKAFASDMGVNVWLRQGGYLFVAQSAEVARRLEKGAALCQRHGVKTEMLTPDAAREIVPQLSLEGASLCAFNPEDGVLFPWPFLWGYAQSAQKRGVRVETFTQVDALEVASGKVVKVKTGRGDISCEQVVLAAGAWSKGIAARVGVTLPNRPVRHEILSTEPLKPFLGPLVSVLDSGLYFSQSMRGELVGGMGDPEEPAGLRMDSSLRFLSRFARSFLASMPSLGSIKVLRQWAGCYDVTPDNQPILGRTPGLPNLLQMSGFVGHGFMMAPAVAERMAHWMVKGEPDDLFTRFNLSRFAEGRVEREEMIIG